MDQFKNELQKLYLGDFTTTPLTPSEGQTEDMIQVFSCSCIGVCTVRPPGVGVCMPPPRPQPPIPYPGNCVCYTCNPIACSGGRGRHSGRTVKPESEQ